MRVKKVVLKNFKRFTDLVISDIPESSKLVLLIGSNGSGKSSLFDAFDWLNKGLNKELPPYEQEVESYYRKNSAVEAAISVEFTNGSLIEKKGTHITKGRELAPKFIGRSSTINDDVFLYIQEINNALREPVFKGKQADTLEIFRAFIEPLNNSLLNIFGGDENTTIQIAEFQDPIPGSTPGKLIFKKGESKINYDLLSHGEKQIIILLINFIVRHKYYEDSIIFIDEMDGHLNTALQSNLLEEIVSKWIPDSSQLWTASHALGFIDYAKNSEIASIIDLDLLNFDSKKELIPLSKDNLDVYEIAIPKSTIASILQGYKLVIVENKNAKHFNAALGESGYLFLPANNSFFDCKK